MRIRPVPCLSDNYAYLVICETSNKAAVVDPSQGGPVIDAVEEEGVELAAIWNTHHHFDHVGGNKELLDVFPSLQVVGHSSDKGRIPGQSRFVDEGDQVTLGDELSARIIFNPAHTRGAISYLLDKPGWVFTGDTLFTGGCGRLFEGTPAQMLEAMDKLAALPDETQVYCGHEYTASNLRFAQAVEPDNEAIADRIATVAELRNQGKHTMGSTIAEERATNPFMRSREPEVIAAAKREESIDSEEPADVLGAIRRWKDRY